MGLNTIHDTSDDYMTCYNMTNGTYFKATPENINNRRQNYATGLNTDKFSYILKVNGWCDVSIDDFIKCALIPKGAKVVNIENNLNSLEFRRRIDTNNFQGESRIYLE